MLRRMFKGRKAQSTAEYGILFAAIIAIAAGALTVSLKGAVQTKHEKGLEYMLRAGTDTLQTAIDDDGQTEATILSAAQEVRKTIVEQEGYVDQRVRAKGGAESMHQQQKTTTDSVSIVNMTAGAPIPAP